MRENIENNLVVTCEDIDLTKVSKIEFYVKQREFFRVYTPAVVSTHTMTVRIPLTDAKALENGEVALLQFAFVDESNNHRASEIVRQTVGELLKESGYDPV